jgi:hypothetical protein
LSAVADARAAFDELTRQLVLERRYAVLVRRKGERPPEIPADVREVFQGFEVRACTFPELEPLLDHADRVLVLPDGLAFSVALVRLVLDGAPLAQGLPLPRLVEVGQFFSTLTGGVGGSRMALTFQVYEIHSAPPSPEWRKASRGYRRRGLAHPRVGVGVTALDAASGRVASNFPGLVRLSHWMLLRRAFRDRAMSAEARRKLLARRGLQPEKALLGAAVGAALGFGAIRLLLHLFVTQGNSYAAAILVASAIGAVVSLKSCRICASTVPQALAGGLLAFAGILAGWWWLRLPISRSLFGLAIVVAIFSLAAGVVANPERFKK